MNLTDEHLEYLAEYFIQNKIQERYEITFVLFLHMVSDHKADVELLFKPLKK